MEALHPEDRKRAVESWRGKLGEESAWELRGRIWHARSKGWRWFTARAIADEEGDGAARKWVGTVSHTDAGAWVSVW